MAKVTCSFFGLAFVRSGTAPKLHWDLKGLFEPVAVGLLWLDSVTALKMLRKRSLKCSENALKML